MRRWSGSSRVSTRRWVLPGVAKAPRPVRDGQAQGVQGADVEAPGVAEALPHLVRRPLVVGHQAEGPGGQVLLAEQVPGPFGERPGLARAGRGDDPAGPAPMGDRGELVGRQVGGRRLEAERLRAALLQVQGRDQRHAGSAGQLHVQRPAVAPGVPTVGQGHVGGRRWCRPPGQCPRAGSERRRRRVPQVDGVGPDQVDELVHQEGVVGGEGPRLGGFHLGRPLREVGGQLDHEAHPARPERLELGHDVGGIHERAGRPRPGARQSTAPAHPARTPRSANAPTRRAPPAPPGPPPPPRPPFWLPILRS